MASPSRVTKRTSRPVSQTQDDWLYGLVFKKKKKRTCVSAEWRGNSGRQVRKGFVFCFLRAYLFI